MQFKMFLVVLGINSADPRPPLEFQTMDACKEVKAFYEGINKGGRQYFAAYCLDDGEAAVTEDEEVKEDK